MDLERPTSWRPTRKQTKTKINQRTALELNLQVLVERVLSDKQTKGKYSAKAQAQIQIPIPGKLEAQTPNSGLCNR